MNTENTENLIAPEQLLNLVIRAQKAIREVRKNIIGKQPINELTKKLDSNMGSAKTWLDYVEEAITEEISIEK